ncbi:YhcN/YlaJ family sporulation lipoprotein [Staphylospora marina]|uniref:YhcN/YlaJ family sporulation lipoprotein n=1 Tax=Staphylospora marina TaxID=2490858 RepID=UPI000F5C08E3|nr:YhcN/YlaJ family sporulation lipoprotein [Staphylospora marina]
MNKRIIAAAMASVLVLTGIGCAGNRQAHDQDQTIQRITRVNDGMYRDTDRNARRQGNFVTDDRDLLARGIRTGDDIARQLEDMREIDNAYVILVNRVAYVAVTLPQKMGGKMTQRLKDRVAGKVKSVDPSIRTVYVSANPDFVKQWRNFANDIRRGRPVSAIIDNLSDVIRRTFPEAK